jgi:hypothetical protein
MTTNVDAVYALDLSTRSARPYFSGDWRPAFPPSRQRLTSCERRLSYRRAEASVRGTFTGTEVKRGGGVQAH